MSEIKIGDVIKEARIQNGFKTMKDLSIVSGVSPATLSRIEKNTQDPSPETLMKISKHLNNITYGELMKVAGYLDGLSTEHEMFMKDLMNENEELDNKIFDLINTAFLYKQVDNNIQSEIVELFVSKELVELYENADSDEIKSAFLRNDFDVDQKREIVDTLNVLVNKFSPKLAQYFSMIKNMKPIPLVGNICAGNGMIPIDSIEEYINYPFVKSQQPDYALRVKGNSMIGAGIDDGDIVFLRKGSWAEFNGQIVAALFNGEEGSLKRMRWSEGSPKITLIPENNSYQSVEVMPNEVTICGVYAGHYKPEF
ncbi:helix-turn-helix domain-containing protein [Paenibacillus xylanexedens]|uniref:SOS-response transcriptional repressor LexA n=1 Tax=Paenibacillus xylanexedens TaxID=528191 RepID=A0ABS4RSM6_PAEXY|nr:S24 family peptidase [Paenibacillus xylanexedens]MBP2245340.1 SOS-response transcriptional repressor LexA [Paenibacillus xylanexedens]